MMDGRLPRPAAAQDVPMSRIATAFIVICMVLIAAALGVVLHVVAGLDALHAGLVGLTVFAAMILHHVITMRGPREDDDSAHLTDLSHGVGDLARQVAEFGRRLTAIEHRVVAADIKGQQRVDTMLGEIGELGALVRQLAVAVAEHEDVLSGFGDTPAAVNDDRAGIVAAAPAEQARDEDLDFGFFSPAAAPADNTIGAALTHAIADGRIEIYLQPLVALPQRKVRFYEALARLRGVDGTVFAAERFLPVAEAMGLSGQIDTLVAQRAMQVLRRLIAGNQDIGLICNVAAATLADPAAFAAYRDMLETHRALASALTLEFRHADLRGFGEVERRHLGTLAGYGYRFSIDHVGDLRIKPRDLAERGVRFIKVPATLLLDEAQGIGADIHPADLADLLGRFGIELVAEHIEDERVAVDLLDYEVRLGQGNLFSPPRPLRPERDQSAAVTPAATASRDAARQPATSAAPVRTGTAALLRRAAGGTGTGPR
jgi:cyclic-di-GMP phosphodiesterase TipF (flagellum assembly factor)